MSITLEIPDEIARAAERLARESGETPEQVLLGALKAYFPPAPPDLQAEVDAWELASEQDAAALERREGLA